MNRRIFLIAHNLRSTHNVGSLLRTAEGLGVEKVYLTGYTPYPAMEADERLPHLAAKLDKQIDKTALGAAKQIAWEHQPDIDVVLKRLKVEKVQLVALEQTPESLNIREWQPPQSAAFVVGNERYGLEPEVIKACDTAVQIPMQGQKESFNVVQAAAMSMFFIRYLIK